MHLPAFTPRDALAWAFHPRLWMGVAPQDRPAPGEPCWWAAFLFNEGPALFGVEVAMELPGGGGLHQCLDILAEGDAGYLFLGGPDPAPPEGVLQVRGRTAAGLTVEGTFRCRGPRRPGLLPPRVAARPVLPLVPGLGWSAEEYLPVLRELPEQPPGSGSRLQHAWIEAAWRWLHESLDSPTLALAREIAWAATAAVFAARARDRLLPEVDAALEALGLLLQAHAAEHFAAQSPARDLPRRSLALALVPGAVPVLHVLNPGPRPVQVVVTVERYRWGRHSAALAPLASPSLRVPARSAAAVAVLRPWDPEQEVECRLRVLGPEDQPAVRLHALFPAGTTTRSQDAIPVPLLGGRRAHVRCLEALLLPPGQSAA